jgi:hypothetical protein
MAISNRVAIDLNSSKYVADEAPFGGRGPALRLEEPRQIKDRPLKQRRLTEPHHNRRTTSPVQTPVEPKEIGFYLYPGFSALDLSGPLEVFATSGSVGRSDLRISNHPPFAIGRARHR